ncbi:MAG: hypothetical protein D9N11_15310, partial [Ketobacter sp.]
MQHFDRLGRNGRQSNNDKAFKGMKGMSAALPGPAMLSDLQQKRPDVSIRPSLVLLLVLLLVKGRLPKP